MLPGQHQVFRETVHELFRQHYHQIVPTAEPVVLEPPDSQEVTPTDGKANRDDTDDTPADSVRGEGVGSALAKQLGIAKTVGPLKVKLRTQRGSSNGSALKHLAGAKISFPDLKEINEEDVGEQRIKAIEFQTKACMGADAAT